MAHHSSRCSEIQDFWGEIAPCNHILQVYENTDEFISTLTGFVFDGFNSGDSIIVIARADHLEMLNSRLIANAIDINELINSGQYKPLDAEETLSRFMVNGWPDEQRFMSLANGLLSEAKKGKRKVRAFGEMVAILWQQGNSEATVQLEHLWNKFCSREELCLFCAYPKSGFTKDANESLNDICASHTLYITSGSSTSGEISYQPVLTMAV